jgi:hypothetical protein
MDAEKACGFGEVCTKRKAGGNLDYISVMQFCLALVTSIMMYPGIARATKDRKKGTFASDEALMKHPPPPPPPPEAGALLEDASGQGVMVSPTSAQTAFEKLLSFPAVS